ncbi:hypothetical protein QR680_007071 [Steinernema hermaphroditum]|uniref:Uncharacterized protein n=1 Tax=Steinernema hermaphroditum TaxID=289476 RepID=A0AA39LYH1_9BILA|nr:hypothetical protein QR680_007071 [Steinernema hermaphroditum]
MDTHVSPDNFQRSIVPTLEATAMDFDGLKACGGLKSLRMRNCGDISCQFIKRQVDLGNLKGIGPVRRIRVAF